MHSHSDVRIYIHELYNNLNNMKNLKSNLPPIVTAIVLLSGIYVRACPLPSCANVTNCEVNDYLTTFSGARVRLDTVVKLSDVINPAFSTDTLSGFLPFSQPDYNLIEQPIAPDSCQLDNQQQCGFKVTAVETQCGFEYQCDYDRNRVPQHLWRAVCTHAPPGLRSIPIYYKLPIMELTGNEPNCNPFTNSLGTWTWRTIEFPVACTCTTEERQ